MTEVMNSKATTADIRLPRHSTIPAGIIAISIAIAAATNAVTMSVSHFPPFPPFLLHQLVHHHDVALGIDAEHEGIGREAGPADQQRPAGNTLGRVVPEAGRRSRNALGGCSPWTSRRHRAR